MKRSLEDIRHSFDRAERMDCRDIADLFEHLDAEKKLREKSDRDLKEARELQQHIADDLTDAFKKAHSRVEDNTRDQMRTIENLLGTIDKLRAEVKQYQEELDLERWGRRPLREFTDITAQLSRITHELRAWKRLYELALEKARSTTRELVTVQRANNAIAKQTVGAYQKDQILEFTLGSVRSVIKSVLARDCRWTTDGWLLVHPNDIAALRKCLPKITASPAAQPIPKHCACPIENHNDAPAPGTICRVCQGVMPR